MTKDKIEYMLNRFLGWKLPKTFNPDAGISYTPPHYGPDMNPENIRPSGTNLFDAQQAKEMIEYLVEGMPATPPATALASEEHRNKLMDEIVSLRTEVGALKLRLAAPTPSTPAPVAWYDPSNKNPGQSVTFDPVVHATWPHIYKQALVHAAVAPSTAAPLSHKSSMFAMDAALYGGDWPSTPDTTVPLEEVIVTFEVKHGPIDAPMLPWTKLLEASSNTPTPESVVEVGEVVGEQKLGFQTLPLVAWSKDLPRGTKLYTKEVTAGLEDIRDKWKIIDGDCREGADGLITYHVDAFDEGYKMGKESMK